MGPIHLHHVSASASPSPSGAYTTPCRRRPPRSSDASPAVAAAATKSPLTTKFKVDFQVAVGWASHQKLRAERRRSPRRLHDGGGDVPSRRKVRTGCQIRICCSTQSGTYSERVCERRYVQTAMYRPLGRFSLPYPHLGFTTQYYVRYP